MRVLGIETSCDETSAAVVENGQRVLSLTIATSRSTFESLGGVIPEAAAREQLRSILPVIEKTLRDAGNLTPEEIDAIAVTKGPGLLGSLLVGTSAARVLGSTWRTPVIGVHHTLGHLSSTWLHQDNEVSPVRSSPTFPILTLSVSGGHTELWYRTAHTRGMILGSTRDDAAGEAFDKGASMLGLPYPGGPSLEKLAKGGDPDAFAFPLPFHADPHCDFSFSGLKTALKYLIARLGGLEKIPAEQRASIAASYQHAIGQHLIDKLQRAMKDHRDVREIHMVGGVAANRSITKQCDIIARTYGLIFRAPAALAYCTDNGAMIAAAGTFLAEEESLLLTQPFETSATASLASALEAH